jgi:DegV family protein with EDD domain
VTPELKPVGVLTDSTADFPPDVAAREGVTVVPLLTTFPNGDSFRDGQLSQPEFFERMGRSGALPTTSQPPVGDFLAAYERLLGTCEQVVSIHCSGRLSGTIEAARQAAANFGERVKVIDSLNLTWGLGFQVLAAARAAEAGAAADDVVRTVERTRDRVRLIVGLDSLDNLARGGRIGAVSAFLGGLLGVKVLLTVSPEGVFEPVARLRGMKAALQETIEFVKREMGDSTSGAFCFMHALSLERAERLRDTVCGMYVATEEFVLETGAVLATHSGTAWAIAFVPGGL